jgi:hypothetical protein
MKKISAPGFEFAFALGLLAIFALPPIVMAQDNKEFKVTISNNDTTINGKNIKELSANERKSALKKLDDMSAGFSFKMENGSDTGKRFVLKMRKNGDQSQDIVIEKNGGDGEVIATLPDFGRNFSFRTDSAGRMELPRLFKDRGEIMPDMNFNYLPRTFGGDEPQVFSFNTPRGATTIRGMNRKNSQSFSYSNTDKDGISTHINFNAGDASAENTKRITGSEKAELEIRDLSITPLFSSGKTSISFSIPAGAAEVSFKNTEGKVLWTDKTSSGSFSKSFELPQNGVYYLQVKQGAKTGLKRITKEE